MKKQFFEEFQNIDEFEEKNKDKHFNKILGKELNLFNEKKINSDSILDGLREVVFRERDIIIDAEKLLSERNETINNIREKSENLLNDSVNYRAKTKKIKKKQKCNKLCTTITSIIILLIIGYGIAVYVCGGFKLPKCINN